MKAEIDHISVEEYKPPFNIKVFRKEQRVYANGKEFKCHIQFFRSNSGLPISFGNPTAIRVQNMNYLLGLFMRAGVYCFQPTKTDELLLIYLNTNTKR